jgi:hypothetical protein
MEMVPQTSAGINDDAVKVKDGGLSHQYGAKAAQNPAFIGVGMGLPL